MTAPARETRTAARGRRTIDLGSSMIVSLLVATAAWADDVPLPIAGGPPPDAGEVQAPLATSHGRWVSVGLLTGSLIPDRALADYQWDTSPTLGLGAQALAGSGRLAAGLRVWSAETTQEIGVSGAPEATTVRGTSLEFIGRGRIATWWGLNLLATGGVGRLHLGYDPDEVTIDAGGTPVTVAFSPVDTWIGGGGVALQRTLAAGWTAGVEVERRMFQLDTAHRRGDEIVTSRESFAEWNARAELAWRHGRP